MTLDEELLARDPAGPLAAQYSRGTMILLCRPGMIQARVLGGAVPRPGSRSAAHLGIWLVGLGSLLAAAWPAIRHGPGRPARRGLAEHGGAWASAACSGPRQSACAAYIAARHGPGREHVRWRPAALAAAAFCERQRAEEPAGDVRTEGQTSLLVGTYWYPWYGPQRRHWQDGYRNTPLLGEYHSADPEVIHQQIAWAAAYGIDFWVASWWGPDSAEHQTIFALFCAEAAARLRLALLYETAGRLRVVDGRIDLDDAANRRTLVEDLRRAAEAFLDQPNYLHIDQRPVVFLYLTRIFAGDVAGALAEARAAIQQTVGREPYFVGDEVYWHQPSPERLALFDAVTAYNMHASVPNIAERFVEKVAAQYDRWSRAAQRAGVAFVPGVLPGFDDRAVRPRAGHPPIPRSVELFQEQLAAAQRLAVGQPRMVMITSWNEWHEDTSIEPAREYGFEYLEGLRAWRRRWQASQE